MGAIPPSMAQKPDGYFKDNDVETAKKLLEEGMKELGISKLPEVTLSFNSSEAHKKIAESIQDKWKKALGVGIHDESDVLWFFSRKQRKGSYNKCNNLILQAKEIEYMYIQLIRHATLRIVYGGRTLLVDPMFSEADKLPATPNTPNQRQNPVVDLSVSINEVLDGIDAILVTHTHRDHLDDAAIDHLPKNIPLFCQPSDHELLRSRGFEQVIPVQDEYEWEGISLYRTGGQHGTGEIGEKMGAVSGFVLGTKYERKLYITGDTIWCEEVKDALKAHQPEVIVAFAGAAQFLTGDPITMTKEDLVTLAHATSASHILVAHMEAWNHCLLSREELHTHLREQKLTDRVKVPVDGEIMQWGS